MIAHCTTRLYQSQQRFNGRSIEDRFAGCHAPILALYVGSAIARALMGRPQLLVLDEPSEGIQPSIILNIENAVRQIVETSDVFVLTLPMKY